MSASPPWTDECGRRFFSDLPATGSARRSACRNRIPAGRPGCSRAGCCRARSKQAYSAFSHGPGAAAVEIRRRGGPSRNEEDRATTEDNGRRMISHGRLLTRTAMTYLRQNSKPARQYSIRKSTPSWLENASAAEFPDQAVEQGPFADVRLPRRSARCPRRRRQEQQGERPVPPRPPSFPIDALCCSWKCSFHPLLKQFRAIMTAASEGIFRGRKRKPQRWSATGGRRAFDPLGARKA